LSLETGALVAVAILITVLALLRSRGREEEFADVRPSTFFPGKAGLGALYLGAEGLGLPVKRWMRPFARERGAPELHALAVVATDEPLTATEATWLRTWVEDGGRLFYVPRPEGDDRFLDSLGLRFLFSRSREARKFSFTVPKKVELADTPALRAAPDAGGVISPEALRLLEGTPERVLGFPMFLDAETPEADRTQVLLTDGASGTAAALLTLGRGRAVVFSHALGITNGSIVESGAAPLCLRALADLSAGETLWFDEFHHGFDEGGGVGRTTWRFLRTDRIGWALDQLALLGVTAVFFAGLRLGRPEPPSRTRRRSSLEHVSALAAAYSSAGSRERPAALLLEGLRLRLGARTKEGILERLSAIAAREPATADSVAEIVRALGPGGGDADLPRLARAIDRVVAALGERGPRAD